MAYIYAIDLSGFMFKLVIGGNDGSFIV